MHYKRSFFQFFSFFAKKIWFLLLLLYNENIYNLNRKCKMKEKTNKPVLFLIQPSLYDQFQKKCEEDYKTISQALRDLVIEYVKEKK